MLMRDHRAHSVDSTRLLTASLSVAVLVLLFHGIASRGAAIAMATQTIPTGCGTVEGPFLDLRVFCDFVVLTDSPGMGIDSSQCPAVKEPREN
jgi:hypothetical protein